MARRRGRKRSLIAERKEQQQYTQQRQQAEAGERSVYGNPTAAARLAAAIHGKTGWPLTGMEADLTRKPGASEDEQRLQLFAALSMIPRSAAMGLFRAGSGGMRDAIEDLMTHWRFRDLPAADRRDMANAMRLARRAYRSPNVDEEYVRLVQSLRSNPAPEPAPELASKPLSDEEYAAKMDEHYAQRRAAEQRELDAIKPQVPEQKRSPEALSALWRYMSSVDKMRDLGNPWPDVEGGWTESYSDLGREFANKWPNALLPFLYGGNDKEDRR